VTTNGTAVTRTHGPTHELLTSGGQNVTTDVKGNQTVLPASLATQAAQLAFAWDFDNKLKSSDIDNNGSADVTFEYDALGRRVARTEGSTAVVYFQADQQTIADYPRGGAASTATYRYVFGSYIDEPVVRKTTGTSGTVLYYHRNQQYSIYALTDSSGAVSERYAYTAYGQPTFLNASATVQTSSAAGNRYTYTAREWDTTLGLHYFRARWMSGLTGRFLTRDLIGYRDGFSLFRSFIGMSDVDPSGLQCCIHLWLPRSEGEVGHAALKCSGNYFSFWPQTGCGLFGCTPCRGHTEAQDEAAEGRAPDQIKCLKCDLDEQAMATKWQQVMNECANGSRRFCTLGGNCSTSVSRLLKSGTPPCSEKCSPGLYFVGCRDRCGGGPDEGVSGIDRPQTVGNYFACLENENCAPMLPDCRENPKGWGGTCGHRW
jgi:RHS repeat-associated protein